MPAAEPTEQDYTARSASVADAPAILELLRASFDRWPPVELAGSALEHLEWKLTCPGHETAPSTVAVHRDGALAAVLVRWFAIGTIEGRSVTVNSTVDVAVHPDHRRRGLVRLMDAFDFEAGVGGEIGVDLKSGSEAIQYMFAEFDIVRRPVRTWMRPLGARRIAARLARQLRSPREFLALATAVLRPAGRPTEAGVAIEEIDTFDDRADQLWSAIRARFAYSRDRGATYLNWRHADSRSGARTILAAFPEPEATASPGSAETDERPLLGWAVLRRRGGVLHLVDLAAHPDRPDVEATLLARCVHTAKAAGATALVTWLPAGQATEAAHRRAGFVPVGESFPVQIWITQARKAPPELIDPLRDGRSAVHLTMADFDFN